MPKKPEKKVESDVLEIAHALGFSLDVIESKAVYSFKAKRYLRGSAPIGFCDLVGDINSIAAYIELKEPNKKNNLSKEQREFLLNKIERNCFAICTYSANHFHEVYRKWVSLPLDQRKAYLLSILPIKSSRKNKNKSDPLNSSDQL